MASNIDPNLIDATKPETGLATTASVRSNFSGAKDNFTAAATEITSLQNGSGGGSVDLRMFGADPTGATDTSGPFAAALAYAKANGLRNIVGRGTYMFSSTVDVSNISATGISVSLERVIADPNWPAPAPTSGFPALPQWRNAAPIFDIGTSGGSMVNHDWRIGSFDGASRKADLFRMDRCGGSRFWVGFAQNFNIQYKLTANNGNTASNELGGNYAQNGNCHVYTTGTPPFQSESLMITTNFVQNCSYGGCIFGEQSNFPNAAKGQFDFSGRNLVELTLTTSASAWALGAIVTGGTTGTLGEVISTYADGGVFKALVLREVNSEGNPGFSSSETVSDGTNVRTITATRTTAQPANFYFDLITAGRGTSFSRGFYDAPYLGGFVGNFLNSMKIFWANSNNASIAWINGTGFASSSTQSLIYSHVDGISTPGSPALEITVDLFAPHRDIYLNAGGTANRIYNSDSDLLFPQNTWVTVLDQSTVGATSFGRSFLVGIRRKAAADTHRAELKAHIDSAGNLAFDDMGSTNLSFQVTPDNKLQAMQTDIAASVTMRRTILKDG